MLLAAAITTVACGGRKSGIVAPSDPEIAVRGFLNAAAANNLFAMGQLWGDTRGPASTYMDERDLEQRLTVIRVYLEHERFEILPPDAAGRPVAADRRIVRVRLLRKGCTPIVPFTVERWGQGWLVYDIDLAAAGNPTRRCTQDP